MVAVGTGVEADGAPSLSRSPFPSPSPPPPPGYLLRLRLIFIQGGAFALARDGSWFIFFHSSPSPAPQILASCGLMKDLTPFVSLTAAAGCGDGVMGKPLSPSLRPGVRPPVGIGEGSGRSVLVGRVGSPGASRFWRGKLSGVGGVARVRSCPSRRLSSPGVATSLWGREVVGEGEVVEVVEVGEGVEVVGVMEVVEIVEVMEVVEVAVGVRVVEGVESGDVAELRAVEAPSPLAGTEPRPIVVGVSVLLLLLETAGVRAGRRVVGVTLDVAGVAATEEVEVWAASSPRDP